ncbi:MAG: hypothetical protein R2867_25450 [Caldilineaceae bacterium]
MPETHEITVVLERKRGFFRIGLHRHEHYGDRWGQSIPDEMEQHPVKDGHRAEARQLVAVKLLMHPDDVVALPFTGFATSIDQWRILAMSRAGRAVGIGRVVIAVDTWIS